VLQSAGSLLRDPQGAKYAKILQSEAEVSFPVGAVREPPRRGRNIRWRSQRLCVAPCGPDVERQRRNNWCTHVPAAQCRQHASQSYCTPRLRLKRNIWPTTCSYSLHYVTGCCATAKVLQSEAEVSFPVGAVHEPPRRRRNIRWRSQRLQTLSGRGAITGVIALRG
jgi:hypothetical protein